jgi:hypothetical protein
MKQSQNINPILGWFPPPLPPFTLPQPFINDNDVINIGSGTQIVGSGNPSPVTVTNVTTPTYTADANDYLLCEDTSTTPVTITLPAGILGTVYMVKDCSGDANTNPITINGTGENVDGSSATINTPYGSIQLIFNGTEWSIV